ncbi:SDR family NAD(P)-dependent oxidoreductase [Streptomyces sp. NPDC060184]|uniref:SDR family NAD(P)-dependent oxidoreductase n=1 Tax=Streptomyces sp. NPDC060184 TaxID=3347064 RepID=UPI003653C108
MRLKGKTAVITGGTRGLGLAIAREFLTEGANVVCAARSRGDVGKLLDQQPEHTRFLLADVSDPGAMRDVMRTADAEFGGVDTVVANAGVNRDGKIESLAYEDWRAVMDTNLTGVFLSVQAAVPYLRKSGGSVITVSSCMGSRVAVGAAGYAASKAAVEMFTRVAAIELGRTGVRVNSLAPGFLDEGMGRELVSNERAWEAYRKRFALGRAGEVGEAARAAVFLASEDASYVNGEILGVNGGLLWA